MPKPDSGEKPKSRPKPEAKPQSGDNRRGAIAGLIIVIVILGVGWWLARDLTAASKMQDCLMSGRRNCNVIEPAR
ncbi:cell division septal protein FtsQ [Bradyrhizobium sp. LM2.7]